MELQQDGPILLQSEFQQFRGKPVRPHCFLVCHCFHRCGNLLLRGLDPEGTRDWLLRQPLRYVGIEHVGFRVQQRTEESHHLSRIRPLSRNSLLSSSWTRCDSTFFVSSGCTDLMFWKNPCWSPISNCFSNSTTWRSKKRNDCCTSHSLQPVTCVPDGPPQLCISDVCFQALPRCVHHISRSLKLSFRLGFSTPASSWPPSFLGRDHQFSGPYDGCGECGFYVIHIAVSRRVCPEVPSNCCGYLLSKLGSVTRRLRSTGGLAETLSRRLRAKWPRSLTGADTMLWSEIGRKEGWGCIPTSS